MKKSSIVFSLVIAAALSLSGCGSQKDDNSPASKQTTLSGGSAVTTTVAPTTGNVPQTPVASVTTVPGGFITRDQALSIAYGDAKVSPENARDLDVELDRNDTVAHYEIEFKSGETEYDYDIHAKTGEILFRKQEPID